MTQRIPLSRFLLPLLLCLPLVACDALTSTSTRLARAGKALEAGKPEAALADVRVVIDRHKDNAAAHLLLARISLKYGDGQSALKEVEQAASEGAGDKAALQEVRDEALLMAGRYQELVDSQVSQPPSVVHQVIVAKALASLNRRDNAMHLVESVLATDKANLEARLLQVKLLQGGGNTPAAQTALQALLHDSPDQARAWILQGQFDAAAGDNAAAAAAFGKAIPVAAAQLSVPEQAGLFASRIQALLATGDVAAAASPMARLKARAPRWPVTALLSARVALAQGDASSAVGILQRSLADNPDQSAARLLLGDAFIKQGAVEQARAELTSLIADEPQNLDARKLLAQFYAQQGDPQAAQRVLTDLPEGVTADPATDWMRSALLSMSGQQAQALTLLEQAAKADPSNVAMQLDLVRGYLAAGRREDASRVLAGVPAQKSGWAGKQLQVLTRVLGVSEPEARRALAALAADNPADAELRTAIGQTLLLMNQPDAAAEQFRGAVAVDSKLAAAHMGLAAVAMRARDPATAQQELTQVIALQPATEGAYLGLAAIATQQHRDADARQWLERAISAKPGAVDARLALGEMSLREQKTAAGDALLKQAVNLSRDKVSTLARVGEIQLLAKRPAMAATAFKAAYQMRPSGLLATRLFAARKAAGRAQPEAVLREWLQKQPDDAAPRAALAGQLLETGDLRGAKQEYEKLVHQAPTPVLLNNLAWVYQQTGDPRAEATAKRASEGAPNNPQIADTYGWILLQKGHGAEALPLLKKAAEMLPRNAEVQEHYRRAQGLTKE